MPKNKEKTKKLMSKAEAIRFHKTWTIAFILGGILMMLIGTEGAIALYDDIWQGLVWWLIGILFMGVGIGELQSYRKVRTGEYLPVQEKIGNHDEKIQGSEQKNP